MQVTQAKIQRLSERNGQQYAEIHMEVEGVPNSGDAQGHPLRLVAYVWKNGDSFQMPMVYVNQSSEEIDWYDNALHQSFELIEPSSWMGGFLDREELLRAVLEKEDIREELEYLLR